MNHPWYHATSKRPYEPSGDELQCAGSKQLELPMDHMGTPLNTSSLIFAWERTAVWHRTCRKLRIAKYHFLTGPVFPEYLCTTSLYYICFLTFDDCFLSWQSRPPKNWLANPLQLGHRCVKSSSVTMMSGIWRQQAMGHARWRRSRWASVHLALKNAWLFMNIH